MSFGTKFWLISVCLAVLWTMVGIDIAMLYVTRDLWFLFLIIAWLIFFAIILVYFVKEIKKPKKSRKIVDKSK